MRNKSISIPWRYNMHYKSDAPRQPGWNSEIQIFGHQPNRISVKSAVVDGKKIKADTWYSLVDGKFKEAK